MVSSCFWSGSRDSVQVPLSSFGGQPFDLTGETVYYFQGFAYNRGEVLATDNADSIAAHQFSSGSLAGATLVPSSGEGVVVAATVTPITYRFQPVSGGVNLNDFAVLTVPLRVANVAGTSAMDSVNTIGGFVTAVNAVAGSSVITTIGWLENGKIVGYYITYSDTGVPVYTPTTGAGADPSRVELVRGKAYQIGVSAAVTVTLSAAPASE